MFGAFKKLLGKAPKTEAPAKVAAPLPKAAPPASPVAMPKSGAASPAKPRAKAAAPSSAKVVIFNLAEVVDAFPLNLQNTYAPGSISEVTFSLPTEKILPQLTRGSVKISFGELRSLLPTGVLAQKSSEDGTLIDLPLATILGQVRPDSFARRVGQHQLEVPEDVSEVFNTQGQAQIGTPGGRKAPPRTTKKKFRRKPAAETAPVAAAAPAA